ncbi:MAG: fenitrothion hydrolase, partial [Acidimicrobiaceae bacterium]|nr:fenitrothion hydrolase [Acidimicrobiaceae bacterium]
MRRILRRIPATGAMAAAALWMSADVAAAHGVGGRLDLPVPLWQLAWAASFAVAASFVALGMFWDTPKFRAAAAGRILPKPFQTACRVQAMVVRTLGLLALAVLLYAGLAGNTNPSVNITPVAVYIIFWVGLQVVSVLAGDVWLHLSPFTTIADGSAR